MTDDDILRMAIECQLVTTGNREGIYSEALMRFAALVEAAARADEREECAKLCDDMDSTSDYYGPRVELICAEAIRARGEA